MSSEFYITLTSSACLEQYPGNSVKKFTNKLCTPLCLEQQQQGEWQVALEDLSFPFKCFNIIEPIQLTFIVPCQETCVPPPRTRSASCCILDGEFHSAESTPIDTSCDRRSTPKRIVSVSRSATLSRGYYRSAEEIGIAITSLFRDVYKERLADSELCLDLDYEFSEMSNKFTFIAIPLVDLDSDDELNITLHASDWSTIGSILGIETTCSGTFVISQTLAITNLHCCLPVYRRLYVCSDIVDYQQFCPTSAKILASLPIDHSGRTECKHVGRFLPVKGTHIECIEIEIFSNIQHRTLFQVPAHPSEYDFVECTLHFRRKSILSGCI